MRLIETNLFDVHCAPRMAKVDESAGQRITRLWRALDYKTSAEFATEVLGVSPQRLNNVENGKPLGRDLANKIIQAVPGVTTDWLWYGTSDGLSVALARKLGELGTKAG